MIFINALYYRKSYFKGILFNAFCYIVQAGMKCIVSRAFLLQNIMLSLSVHLHQLHQGVDVSDLLALKVCSGCNVHECFVLKKMILPLCVFVLGIFYLDQAEMKYLILDVCFFFESPCVNLLQGDIVFCVLFQQLHLDVDMCNLLGLRIHILGKLYKRHAKSMCYEQ